MKSYDLSGARWKSRWRKLKLDPAAFAADLPWAVARGPALGALWLATWVGGRPRLRAYGRAAALRLSRLADDLYGLEGTSPAMLEVLPVGVEAVACSLGAGGEVLGACLLQPATTGFLPAGPRLAKVRVYPVALGDALADRLEVRPAGRLAVYAAARAGGRDKAAALRAAWPAARRLSHEMPAKDYARWIARNEPDVAEVEAWGRRAAAHPQAPRISVLMPVHDPDPRHLAAAIRSVREQAYPNWQLSIADDGSASPAVRQAIDTAAREDGRISVARQAAPGGLAAATNTALAGATGEVCLFLDHDDELAPFALAAIALAFAEAPELQAVYSDEDTIDAEGRRSAPLFKPDLDRERLLRQNYVNHAFAVRTELLRELGGLAPGVDGAQDHDLVLRVAERGPVRRLPHILYHWRSFPGGRSLSQRDPGRMWTARAKVVADALARQGRPGRPIAFGGNGLELELPLPDPPRVAVIVPTRDGGALLRACAAGLLLHTDYPRLELHLIDNGSQDPDTLRSLQALAADPRVRLHREDGPFNFSALNNAAVARTDADILLFLNDDVLVAEPLWLRRMVELAVGEGIGAVGVRLLYPDGRLQHAGLILGLGPQGVAGHEFRGAPGDATGPQNRLGVTRQASAVTAACLAVKRDRFLAVGGFDERLAVAFNDVDLCLKLGAAGFRNLWTPLAQLVHMESASRGSDRTSEQAARFAAEAQLMRRVWGAQLDEDPCYNPNLTLEDESFAAVAVSRATRP